VSLVVVDTSAWVEFDRATGSPVHLALRELIRADDGRLVVTDPVAAELCAGAKTTRHLADLRRLLARFRWETVEPGPDFAHASTTYFMCRRRGVTVRSLIDCLIAAVALRIDASVLHRDGDYALIAQVVPLRLGLTG
jgi:predicted nucleic acid-binding protein